MLSENSMVNFLKSKEKVKLIEIDGKFHRVKPLIDKKFIIKVSIEIVLAILIGTSFSIYVNGL